MIPILQNIVDMAYSDQLSQLNDDVIFQNFPAHIFLKNKKGIYIGANACQAQDTGFKKGSDLLGKTDYDCIWSETAANLRANDALVILKKKPQLFFESAKMVDGKVYTGISYKLPLRVHNKKTLGIIGLSFIVNESDLFYPELIKHRCFDKSDSSREIALFSNATTLSKLSKQQKKCLYFLARGYTIKQIGLALEISPRTVEHHLEIAKDKLNCYNRSSLIEKILPYLLSIKI